MRKVRKKKRTREEVKPEPKEEDSQPNVEQRGPPNVHMAPPPPGARVKEPEDEWEIRGKRVIRYHRKPRKVTFTPSGTGCPVDVSKLKSKRVTHSINSDTQVIQECVDEWRCTMPYYNPFDDPNATWTGWTEFEIEDEHNVPVQEEPRGGAKRKADDEGNEGKNGMPDRPDETNEGAGIKRKAEDEGDDERIRRLTLRQKRAKPEEE